MNSVQHEESEGTIPSIVPLPIISIPICQNFNKAYQSPIGVHNGMPHTRYKDPVNNNEPPSGRIKSVKIEQTNTLPVCVYSRVRRVILLHHISHHPRQGNPTSGSITKSARARRCACDDI